MKGLNDALRKALSTTAGAGGDFLPLPLATEFIRYIWDQNFLRQLFRVVTMPTKTLDYPKILTKPRVFYESTEGAAAVQTDFTTATLRLTAKKFFSEMRLSMEVIEDAAQDMQGITRDHFSSALAASEEEAMLQGDVDHTHTETDVDAATSANWYTKDHRLIWDGLLTLSSDIAGSIDLDTRAANRVDAGGGDMTTLQARQAMYNLGKYGRVMDNIVLILNPWSANQLLDDAKLVTLEKYGPKATIFTGEFGKLYGKIIVINSAYCTDGYGVATHVGNPIMGDRRAVKIKSEELISNDQKKFVISERADFSIMRKGALCQIHDLEGASTES
jgi:hypothetical protein